MISHSPKKKTPIDVEIINEKFYKPFKNIIALQDIQIIYLSRPFLFPPFFFSFEFRFYKNCKVHRNDFYSFLQECKKKKLK